MTSHFKALFVVIVITLAVFVLAKPLFTQFMRAEDYDRRRNTWLALTLAAFLIPNYWAYAAVAIAVIGYAVSKEPNPSALYLFLLLALPPLSLDIPTFGVVNALLALDHYRMLSLVLLLPAAVRLRRTSRNPAANLLQEPSRIGWVLTDILIVSYAVLQVALLMPYVSSTSVARGIVLLVLDVLLPYFVISRGCRSRENIVETMASFALAAMVLAPMAVFEFFKSWLLFASLEETWRAMPLHSYLSRGGFLRATVTMGHSIMLGYAMAIAIGFWFYLQTRVDARVWRWLCLLVLLMGSTAAMARGPWVGTVAVGVVFLATGLNVGRRMMKGVVLLAVLGGVAAASPWGGKIIEFLPFVGTIDEGTVVYREQIASASWVLIQQHPLFGSPFFMAQMENFRQGEGIIDLVNVYASVALVYGLGGLGLFIGFFAVAGLKCFAVVRRFANEDPDFSQMGSSLLACMVGALVIIATVSNYLIVPYLYWSLGALIVAYVQLAKESAVAPTELPTWNLHLRAR
jgi:hypothetical protein